MEHERRKHIPNRLRLHRKQMRYKQKQVAALLGLHPAQLSQWEHGLKLPSCENLIKLCIIYRTFPSELYTDYYQELKEHITRKEWDLFGEGSAAFDETVPN
jgi:transcriptional regulator with XRE-family HTH domain